MSELPLLSLIIFLPWLGALVLALMPRAAESVTRSLALTFSFTTILLGLAALAVFEPRLAGFQLVENRAWIEALDVRYHLGLDGMSLILVLLTGLVAPACLVAHRGGARDSRGFAAFFLFLQGSALGVFLALDFFAWFIFWELSLVPAFFLIKLWGGSGATRAAYQFFVYTMAGSALMLVGFVALYAAVGTFDFETLAQLAAQGAVARGFSELAGGTWAWIAFGGVFAGLAVKTPLFPFHTWLPSAYAEAPTGISMFLTAVMSKMGVYGFFRLLWPIFPEQVQGASHVLLLLALGGVIFGAFAALAQRDLKRMIAYSSVNHVSYCLLALFAAVSPGAGLSANAVPAALNGALLQMFNHGLAASALFFFVGALELRANGRRELNSFGGVRGVAPVLAGMCGVAMFSSIGLPGLNGFVGEFLVFRGVFGVAPWVACAACIGLLVTAIFLLTFYQRVFHGPAGGPVPEGSFSDLTATEVAAMTPSLVLMLVLGVAPQLLIGLVNPLTSIWSAGVVAR